MRFSRQNRRLKSGQTAIFLLLIFQILFVLFAVSLNVALTVHDKINLQNAVDLGAYYGAKKQAEVLNAIAHINFQMRQNYKLLAWRYRILGTATVTRGTNSSGRLDPDKWCVYRKSARGPLVPPADCEDSYIFCVSSNLWERNMSPEGMNLCENVKFRIQRITRLPPPPAFFLSVNTAAYNRQITLRNEVVKDCKAESGVNWLMVQAILTHFRLDQKDRKMMIHAIHNATLKQGRDLGWGLDNDRRSIEEKVKQTIEFNLTEVNKSNFADADIRVYNSLENKTISYFLEPYEIYHRLQYASFSDVPGATCQEEGPRFSSNAVRSELDWGAEPLKPFAPYASPEYLNLFNQNRTMAIGSDPFTNQLIVGYKKKPDIDIYYGVSVSLTHSRKQVFAPTDDLTLKASAFALPFGGRIGPASLDPRIEDGRNRRPNYSRYPGDSLGLVDKRAHGTATGGNYLNKSPGNNISGRSDSWSYFKVLHYLYGLGHNLNTNLSDPLVYTANDPRDPPDPFHPMRLMEITAVSPNLYDIQNYTILNNYKDSYLPKICRLIAGGSTNCASASPPIDLSLLSSVSGFVRGGLGQGAVRGDFGHPYLNEYEGRNLALSQVSSFVPFFFFPPFVGAVDLSQAAVTPPRPIREFHNFFSRVIPPYLVRDPAHFLTGFGLPNYPHRYSNPIDPGQIREMFMKCHKKTTADAPFTHTPHGCAVGGRAGYSVRMLSCAEVKGGLPSSSRAFSNPPSGLNNHYCPPPP